MHLTFVTIAAMERIGRELQKMKGPFRLFIACPSLLLLSSYITLLLLTTILSQFL
jgi:hypothetical protein